MSTRWAPMCDCGSALVITGLFLSMAGCATVLHGSSQTVAITSEPAGAKATILPKGNIVRTPARAELSRKQVHTVRFELDGYRTKNGYVYRTPSLAPFGNVLIGGLIGLAVDSSSGAIWNLTPDPLHVALEPAPKESSAKQDANNLDTPNWGTLPDQTDTGGP